MDPESGAIQRLKDEAELLARLSHPAILKVYDLTLLEGRITLITEYIEGADLDVCAAEDGKIPTRVMLQLMGIISDALDAAWNTRLPDGRRLEIVHRDIKPSNIRLSTKGGVKLLDFGIARSDMVERRVKTSTGSLIGSPGYIAPERFLTDDVDPASDVFAMGAVLFEGLSGERLFDVRMTAMAAMAVQAERYDKHLNRALLQLEEKVCVDLLRQMLAHSPEDRPTAEEVAHRCHGLAQEVEGLDLKAWSSTRTWSEVEEIDGLLEGRVVTEHTLNQKWRRQNLDSRSPTSQSPNSQPPSQASGSPLLKVALSVVAGGLVLLILLLVVGGAGAAAWLLPARNAVSAIAPMPASMVVEEIDQRPELIPEAKPEVKKVKRRVSPNPVAAKAQGVPAAAVAVEPAVVESFSLAFVEGDVAVEFRQKGKETTRLPAKVATGQWEIYAQFNGRDFVPAGTVTVKEGTKTMISCNDVFLQCRSK